MYNGDVPKPTDNKNSTRDFISQVEEGFILPKEIQSAYQFIIITQKQLVEMTDRLTETIGYYEEFGKTMAGFIKRVVESQQAVVKQLQELFKNLAVFDGINTLIQIPLIELPTLNDKDIFDTADSFRIQLQPIRIFVQPNEPYIPPKSLPSSKRKYELPLTSVKIVGNGFAVEGKYIRGMTRKSEVGRLFELIIRSDLKGKIPDELIDEIKSSDSDEFAYRVRSYVMRDLKDILAGNKLKLDMERYRALEEYRFKGLTKYIRKPRKAKKAVMKGETN